MQKALANLNSPRSGSYRIGTQTQIRELKNHFLHYIIKLKDMIFWNVR